MLALAMQGVTSFSVKPIRLIWALGLLIVCLSIVAGVVMICIPGKQLSLAAFSVWLCTGLILSALGLVGEYTGKIYSEVKHRPRYCIMEHVGGEKEK